ncbi:membrane-anchored junction protein [Huso huso]|uniref:Membrane-anchored junction protein n=1 Tax=Huso huso TaxID=61971 RepID=A0ABR0Y267_HUSHU
MPEKVMYLSGMDSPGGVNLQSTSEDDGSSQGTSDLKLVQKMPVNTFRYPLPETRFFHADNCVYKFRIRYGNNARAEDFRNEEGITQELEDAVRVVLANLESVQPFATKHFNIFPSSKKVSFTTLADKSKWERVSELRFKQGSSSLSAHPDVCTLYLELNSGQQQGQAGADESLNQSGPNRRSEETEDEEEVEAGEDMTSEGMEARDMTSEEAETKAGGILSRLARWEKAPPTPFHF